MSRPRPLAVVSIALFSAVVFLLLRVAYRIVFGGAGGSGDVLFDIPRYQLWGVFSHILIGGEVTATGLLGGVTSGLPFAAVIVLSGVVLAWWDPRGLILWVPRLRAGRNLLTAMVIAMSTLPVLVAVVRDTRRAAERRRVTLGRRILLPVLEKTLERSVGINTALISRGVFGHSEAEGSENGSLVALSGMTWPERGIHVLEGAFERGTFSIITGQTGSGKTSLLEIIAGLHPQVEQRHRGAIQICRSGGLGYLPHRAHDLFLSSTVRDEIALSLVLNGMPRADASDEALVLLDEWRLGHLAQVHPSELSAGEAVMVGLMVLTAHMPSLLVLDEPLRSLDPERRKEVLGHLDRLFRAGVTVILSDHRSAELEGHGGNFFTLTSSGLEAGRYNAPVSDSPLIIPRPSPEPDVVARFEGLTASLGERRLFNQLQVDMRRGQVTLLSGDNGVGKTTLLEMVADSDLHKGDVAYVPCEPSDLFFTDSVSSELALADRSSGVAAGLTRMTLEAILSGAWREAILQHFDSTHPRDLSRGQQMALAVAIQMSHRPRVLVLDEPTAGLDDAAVEMLVAVLSCALETGVALLIATQEPEVFSELEGTRLRLHDGVLFGLAEVRP